MKPHKLAQSPQEMIERLKFLHLQRKKLPRPATRKHLTAKERRIVLSKTDNRCHVCGGVIGDKWAADHVLAHAAGGAHSVDNYLPSHTLCNGKRWFYSAEEFQWILKLGVWARKQIEECTQIGKVMSASFWRHQQRQGKRRKR